jgi:hypothetical protein
VKAGRVIAYVRDGDRHIRAALGGAGVAVRQGRLWSGTIEGGFARCWAPDFPAIVAAYSRAGVAEDTRPRPAAPDEAPLIEAALPRIEEATIIAHGEFVEQELRAWQPRGTLIAVNFAAYLLPVDWLVSIDGFKRYDFARLPPSVLAISVRASFAGLPPHWPRIAVESHGLPGASWSLERAIQMAVIAGVRRLWIVGDDRTAGLGCAAVPGGKWTKGLIKSMGGDVDRAIAAAVAAGVAVHRVGWRDGQVEVRGA